MLAPFWAGSPFLPGWEFLERVLLSPWLLFWLICSTETLPSSHFSLKKSQLPNSGSSEPGFMPIGVCPNQVCAIFIRRKITQWKVGLKYLISPKERTILAINRKWNLGYILIKKNSNKIFWGDYKMLALGIVLLLRLYLMEVKGKWKQVHCVGHPKWEGGGRHLPWLTPQLKGELPLLRFPVITSVWLNTALNLCPALVLSAGSSVPQTLVTITPPLQPQARRAEWLS